MKKEDLDDNIKQKERDFEFERMKKRFKLEEKDKKFEEIKLQKKEINEQKRKMSIELEKNKELLLKKFHIILNKKSLKNKNEIIKDLLEKTFTNSFSYDFNHKYLSKAVSTPNIKSPTLSNYNNNNKKEKDDFNFITNLNYNSKINGNNKNRVLN